ncbi:MAG: response regulator [Desulfuromonas sp.]|uniref:response regulator n=1 Tax=Desulfuromonas sp. TaxID=892 RepID=UPI000CAA7EA4|nr:response regulator [Desulfuromonas sp.]PLX84984.1 MAG: response regulator [Desulfuromonas sp.]
MRTLIVEDDFTSRILLQKILSPYGLCDVAVNGREALEALELAHREGQPYQLACLDIMLPELNGQEVLKALRALEKERGIPDREECKVVMTTCLDSPKEVMEAYYRGGCTAYLVKPIERQKLLGTLREFGLIG